MSNFIIPGEISNIVGSAKYSLNDVGMSGSEVRIYDEYVLKIQPWSSETDNEHLLIKWVGGRIPLPEILAYKVENGIAYTLMSKVKGQMLCSAEYLDQPDLLINLAAKGLKLLWNVDVAECPYQASRLCERLKNAEYNVVHGLVDVENTEPGTFGPDGFRDPEDLLEWLKNNKPEEDLVLTHGDYCLPNIFASGSEIRGLIDLGKMGPADRWQDIAIAIRSLKSNFCGEYSSPEHFFEFEPHMLLDALGMEMDIQKYRYYVLLDELF